MAATVAWAENPTRSPTIQTDAASPAADQLRATFSDLNGSSCKAPGPTMSAGAGAADPCSYSPGRARRASAEGAAIRLKSQQSLQWRGQGAPSGIARQNDPRRLRWPCAQTVRHDRHARTLDRHGITLTGTASLRWTCRIRLRRPGCWAETADSCAGTTIPAFGYAWRDAAYEAVPAVTTYHRHSLPRMPSQKHSPGSSAFLAETIHLSTRSNPVNSAPSPLVGSENDNIRTESE